MSRPSAPPEAVSRFRQQLDRLTDAIGGLAPDERIAIAVSGGPDSLALLLLAHAAFPAQAGFPAHAGFPERVLALTVDHGLRSESADEAAMVARLCGELHMPHRTLVLDDLKSRKANMQARARAARYAAMEMTCVNDGIRFLLTAHHADDQAETVLMRLSRGSGLSGLAGIRESRGQAGITVLRPLLGFGKAELEAMVADAGLVAADDPSNRSPSYDRTAARSLLMTTPWLDPLRIAAAAHHLADAEAALVWTAEQAWRGHMERHGDTLLVDMEGLPRELVRRLTVMAIKTLNPDAKLDGPSVERLMRRIDEKRDSTLDGIRVSGRRKWRFVVAPPRRDENLACPHCS